MEDEVFQVPYEANTPFYRYGSYIELIRFKDYYRMPRRHKHISFVSLSTFRDIFSENKIVMGKKIFVQCFDVIMITVFPRNIQ